MTMSGGAILKHVALSSCIVCETKGVSSQEIHKALTHLRPAGERSCNQPLVALHKDSDAGTY